MGKLRMEPINESMTPEKYEEILEILREAEAESDEFDMYWNLEPGEDRAQVRSEFEFVARKEAIPLIVRTLRKRRSLFLFFQEEYKRTPDRLSREAYKDTIINVLRMAGRPLKKSEILERTNLSAATWGHRVQELIAEGVVSQEGLRSQATYSLLL